MHGRRDASAVRGGRRLAEHRLLDGTQLAAAAFLARYNRRTFESIAERVTYLVTGTLHTGHG